MYFIKNIIKKLKALLPIFRNLQPTTYNLQPSRGFTLIETLVAISILMIAIASPLTIAQKGVASAIYAKDQIIASYLAQDAIEFIINKSDINVKTTPTPIKWLDGIIGTDKCSSLCTVDTVFDNIDDCDSACGELKYDKDYSYSYGGVGPTSGFTRSVTVEEVVPDVEALITVKMSWKDKGKPRTLTFQTRIFNWKKK